MTCAAPPALRALRLPVRLDFLGGWSDQIGWPHEAAVWNVAIGWEGTYPLLLTEQGTLQSRVEGVGTGLGISSILTAGLLLQQNPGLTPWEVSRGVLRAEEREGTRGGWQDALGALLPGSKLICKTEAGFRVEQREEHPLLKHCVLFDTGLRRRAQHIGDQVRAVLGTGGAFDTALRLNVEAAADLLHADDDPEDAAHYCVTGWRRLCRIIPAMLPPADVCRGLELSYGLGWGWKLVGAGGGGFGIYFGKEPAALCAALRARGFWAVVPGVLPGVEWV